MGILDTDLARLMAAIAEFRGNLVGPASAREGEDRAVRMRVASGDEAHGAGRSGSGICNGDAELNEGEDDDGALPSYDEALGTDSLFGLLKSEQEEEEDEGHGPAATAGARGAEHPERTDPGLPALSHASSAFCDLAAAESMEVRAPPSPLPEASLTEEEAMHIAQMQSLAVEAGWDVDGAGGAEGGGGQEVRAGVREEVVQFLRVTGSEDAEVRSCWRSEHVCCCC